MEAQGASDRPSAIQYLSVHCDRLPDFQGRPVLGGLCDLALSSGGTTAASPFGGDSESRRRKLRYLRAFRFCRAFKRPHSSGAGKRGRKGEWGGAGCSVGRGVGLGPRSAGLACPGQQGRGGWSGKGRMGRGSAVRRRHSRGSAVLRRHSCLSKNSLAAVFGPAVPRRANPGGGFVD